tara:strand:+ start:681 stop:1184 length:504 start_codon:yes stop_codon:yes gene_type:complete
MPTGLKASSSTVSIGFSLAESAANTFTQSSVDLNLSPLDREVFVVTAINLDPESPDLQATPSFTNVSLTSTSQTAVATLGDANCLAVAQQRIQADATRAVGFQQQSLETPPTTSDYIGIIATNDFFVQVIGGGNANAKGVSGKVYGYRAIANADIYAALVQSEVLSA